MNKDSNTFFEVGVRMGAAAYGVDRDAMTRLRAKQAVMSGPAAAPFNRELCKIACAAFETCGEANTAPAILFRNLSQAQEWLPAYDRFTGPVLRALSKSAGALLPALSLVDDRAGGGIMKTLAAGGALGGAALGSLAYLISRNAQQSSAANARMLEKIRAYKKLKRDIEEDMAATGAMETAA